MKTAQKTKVKRGRRAEIEGGRRVNLYLDTETLAAAKVIGKGSVSAGVRCAIKNMKDKELT